MAMTPQEIGGWMKVLEWAIKPVTFLWHWLTKSKPKIPRETFRLVRSNQRNWWHMGSANKQPAMQISGHWFATNISEGAARILAAYLVKPRVYGIVLVRHPTQRIYGQYDIPPRATTDLQVDFWVQPPVCEEGKPFVATMIFVDQFGNTHTQKNMTFESDFIRPTAQDQPKPEALHLIGDAVEKDVVAILKDELTRYRQSGGRSRGSLGSVETVDPEGRSLFAIPASSWQEGVSKRQVISDKPEAYQVRSDNCDALLRLYESLHTDQQRNSFERALLFRLTRSTEYAPVGYLSLLTFFRLAKLGLVLHAARTSLMGDSAYGFDDVVRLLDGLLRFQHDSFTTDDLDLAEAFVGEIAGHKYQVAERVASVRAFRLSKRFSNAER